MADNILARILDWLRAGYPEGIPQQDYVPLMGILHRNLTDDEVEQLAQQLRDGAGGIDGSVTDDQIREAIQRTALEQPGADDVKRVHARMAAGGWPLVPVKDLEQD